LLVDFEVLMHIPSASAASPLIEIKPEHAAHLPLVFEIRSERLENKDVEFTVKISEGTMKFREGAITAVSKVHVTENSMSAASLRKAPSVREGKWIICVFAVTEKELEDPDLAFYFGMPVPGHPSIDHFYARLKNYLKP
jgi:hypothetical protein